jgi:hypothetical protein
VQQRATPPGMVTILSAYAAAYCAILSAYGARRDAPRAEKKGTEESFASIYNESKWGSRGGGSGDGSTEQNAVGASRILFHLILELNVNSVLDAPCGAMVWQKSMLSQLVHIRTRFKYLGVDVVPSVVEANRRRFSNGPWKSWANATLRGDGGAFRVSFRHGNLASDSWSARHGNPTRGHT